MKYLEFKQVIREELLYMIGKLNDRLGSDLTMRDIFNAEIDSELEDMLINSVEIEG